MGCKPYNGNDRRMLTIGQIAEALELHPDTIRSYERRGIIPRAKRSPVNGYRIWEPSELEIMKKMLRVDYDNLEHLVVAAWRETNSGLITYVCQCGETFTRTNGKEEFQKHRKLRGTPRSGIGDTLVC